MMWTVSIHEAAEMEIDEAVGFYDQESPGLGAAFIDEVQRSLRIIVEFPAASPTMKQ
ncbi:MAG: hypothetical protein JST22_18885 [Bacteroidetes bacterium]|nr:hypothetical protein [Bacteroidota bacterium]